LPLQQAAENYQRYEIGAQATFLERFVCAAADLPALANWLDTREIGIAACVVIPSADTADQALKQLDAVLNTIQDLPDAGFIDVLELRCPTEAVDRNRQLHRFLIEAVDRTLNAGLDQVNFFFELPSPPGNRPSHAWHEALHTLVDAIADYNRTVDWGQQAGFKFRTGGTTPDAVPSCATLATVIDECCRANVFWKATAGLHQPLRHVDESLGAPVHGFVNLFAAAVLAKVHGLRSAQIEPIVDDRDAAHFRFAGDRLTWGKLSVTSEQITAARSHGLRSFGSCSFDEPIAGLRSLLKTI
jgi:hypothetical protein